MSFQATKLETGIVHIRVVLKAPEPACIGADGMVSLENYFTAEQWAAFIKADGFDVEKVIGTSA